MLADNEQEKTKNNHVSGLRLINKLENQKLNKTMQNNLLTEHNMATFHELEEVLDNINNNAENNIIQQIQSYRPPSITEMMMACCRYSCSLRDLLPYCSPFGDWDSE